MQHHAFHLKITVMGIVTLLAVAMLPINAPIPVAAQGNSGNGGGIICYGWYSLDPNNDRVVEGTISNNEPAQEWIFEGEAGTFVNIYLEVTDGNLDPFLFLTDDTTGQRLVSASANNSSGPKTITIINQPLGSDGTYTITATRLGEANGQTAGGYRLSIEQSSNSSIADSRFLGNIPPRLEGLIFDGEVVYGSLFGTARDNEYHVWYFNTSQSQRVNLTITPIGNTSFSNNFGATLYRLDNNEWQYASGIRTNNNEFRLVDLQLQSGLYAIVLVNRLPEVNYQLTFAGAGGVRPDLPPCAADAPECPPTSPLGSPATAITNNVPVDGTITAANPIVVFQFTAFEDDVVTINMQRTGGNLDTFLGLAGSNGNIMERDPGFDPASSTINQFTIPAAGCYYIYASREGVSDGTTEGAFLLTATGISGSESAIPAPPPDITFGGEIALQETLTASIGSGDWRIAYRFLATTDSTVTVQASRINGDLRPAITLLAANYNQLDYVSADFAGSNSNPLTFTVSQGEYYFIVVQREEGADGTTAGDFTVTLTTP